MDKKEESVIIELDTILEYRDGQVFIKKMNTNEMPAMLAFSLMEALIRRLLNIIKKTRNESKTKSIMGF